MCSSSSLALHKKGTFDGASLDADRIKITDSEYGRIWDLSRCNNCTHVFANPYPTQEFIQSLYQETEDPLYQEEAGGRSKNFERILKTLEKMHPQRGTLLDIGAATGILMNISQSRGWRVEGVEPSAWAVRTARERYDLELREGAFETLHLPENYYSVVTMVDFIEHIPHPFPAISKAKEILLPEGTLCLVTPDIDSLAARIMGMKWWHYRPGHLGYFTKKSLGHLLQRADLRILEIRKYSWTFSLNYLLSRKPRLKFLLKSQILASLSKRIPIKLALQDSFEIYAKKNK